MPQSSEWTRRGEFIRLINEAATSPTKGTLSSLEGVVLEAHSATYKVVVRDLEKLMKSAPSSRKINVLLTIVYLCRRAHAAFPGKEKLTSRFAVNIEKTAQFALQCPLKHVVRVRKAFASLLSVMSLDPQVARRVQAILACDDAAGELSQPAGGRASSLPTSKADVEGDAADGAGSSTKGLDPAKGAAPDSQDPSGAFPSPSEVPLPPLPPPIHATAGTWQQGPPMPAWGMLHAPPLPVELQEAAPPPPPPPPPQPHGGAWGGPLDPSLPVPAWKARLQDAPHGQLQELVPLPWPSERAYGDVGAGPMPAPSSPPPPPPPPQLEFHDIQAPDSPPPPPPPSRPDLRDDQAAEAPSEVPPPPPDVPPSDLQGTGKEHEVGRRDGGDVGPSAGALGEQGLGPRPKRPRWGAALRIAAENVLGAEVDGVRDGGDAVGGERSAAAAEMERSETAEAGARGGADEGVDEKSEVAQEADVDMAVGRNGAEVDVREQAMDWPEVSQSLPSPPGVPSPDARPAASDHVGATRVRGASQDSQSPLHAPRVSEGPGTSMGDAWAGHRPSDPVPPLPPANAEAQSAGEQASSAAPETLGTGRGREPRPTDAAPPAAMSAGPATARPRKRVVVTDTNTAAVDWLAGAVAGTGEPHLLRVVPGTHGRGFSLPDKPGSGDPAAASAPGTHAVLRLRGGAGTPPAPADPPRTVPSRPTPPPGF